METAAETMRKESAALFKDFFEQDVFFEQIKRNSRESYRQFREKFG